jgi:hypothetical protein
MGPRLHALGLTVVASFALWAAPAGAATFKVRSAGDAGDATARAACVADGAACTLRAAILEANASGQDHTIQFEIASVPVPTALPEITSNGIFLDGCNKGRAGPGNTPVGPNAAPCTELRGTGSPTGFVVRDVTSARVQGFFVTGFPGIGVHLWGTTSGWIRGNHFGQRANGSAEANGRAIRITGRTQDGGLERAAIGNVVGGGSAAAGSPAACSFLCNLIVNSSITGSTAGLGIDLVGLAQGSGPGDAPAGGAPDDAGEGTAIYGNWIGVRDAAGTAAPNEKAILVGDAQQTTVGSEQEDDANVIAGNGEGVDQGSGQTTIVLMRGLYGISPDRERAVANGPYHARLHGGANGTASVWDATFGPAPIGLELTGPGAEVYGSWFTIPGDTSAPPSGPPPADRFTTAAIRLGPDADGSFVGAAVAFPLIGGGGVLPSGCTPLFFTTVLSDACNAIAFVGEQGAGVLIEGADDVAITRTTVGAPLGGSDVVDGVPIRIRDAGSDPATGIVIGSDAIKGQNNLWRTAGPAVEVGGNAQSVSILGNGGLAVQSPLAAANRFTDLLPTSGPGNTGPVNGGIDAPTISVAEATGVGGTALPGATVRVIEQQRPFDATDPETTPEGFTFPATPATAVADANGFWGITFTTRLKDGQTVLASQTLNGNSSEFAAPAEVGPQPDPIAQITSGPTGLVTATSASFTFTSPTPPVTFECSLDGAAFEACTSPKSYTGLEPGGHLFRVRAVDPVNTKGPPASRPWTIELPPDGGGTGGGGTTGAGTTGSGGSTPGAASGGGNGVPGATPPSARVALSAVLALPSASRCLSRRTLRLRLKTPKGTGIAFARIRVPGKAARTVRGRKLSAPIDLRGLPRGRFTVRFEVTLLDGRVVKGSRTYRTCAPKRR